MGVNNFHSYNSVSYTHLDAIGLIVNGYAKEVLNKLPMEFAVEAQKLLTISLEGSVAVSYTHLGSKIVWSLAAT